MQTAGWRPYNYRANQGAVTNHYTSPDDYINNLERLGSLIGHVVEATKHDFQSRLEQKVRPIKLRDLPNMRLSNEVLLKRVGIAKLEELKEIATAQAYVWIHDRLKLGVFERLLFHLEGALIQQH
ncbi:TfoX/Sxy family DNA transformation protein [Vibrio mediterranei]|uniref:TfoX/Sxy family DNA transformation protein n=1 Tax=Vibrio mediterranei TaxID=689 RepID=UPI001EFCF922|nr:TfoX/Sxy family DNA transformation protein [Vibrio mediterranei]MCG9660802.1 TfoX/Sxy family protein [Vibrio mediterranei]